MTIEQKAKRYDETLKAAVVAHKDEDRHLKAALERIFPELKESEDEKIRKTLIELFSNIGKKDWRDIPTEKIIAWLEKQGDKSTTLPKWKYKKDKTPLLRDSIILNKYGCVAKSPYGAIISDVWVLDYNELAKLPKEEFEKQGEQKPTDNVEPKFKVGDWVVGGATWNNPRQIAEIRKDGYITTYRGWIGSSFEEDMHLWTIQDAKDGDVLATSNYIYIFNSIDKETETVAFYCLMKKSDKHFSFGDYRIHDEIWNSIPATKEQRDTLMKAMADAGYTFDFEKKELKKVEQKSTEWSEEDESILQGIWDEILANKHNSKEYEWKAYDKFLDWLKSLKDRVQPKQEWSEEDIRNIDVIDTVLFYDKDLPEDTCVRLRNWLKSLRPQPKKEWNEEDERTYKSIIYSFVHNYPLTIQQQEFVKSLKPQNNITDEELAQAKKDAYNDALDKIEYHSGEPTFDDGWSAAIDYIRKKSFKPQNHWKPTEAQLASLTIACDRNDRVGFDLTQLLKELKKL